MTRRTRRQYVDTVAAGGSRPVEGRDDPDDPGGYVHVDNTRLKLQLATEKSQNLVPSRWSGAVR